MKILVCNDDGYNYAGIKHLVKILKPYGDIVVVTPKYHQSGASTAVTMGLKPIAVKKFIDEPGEQWWYLDATPASCVKWGLDEIFTDSLPDLLVSGINHGANAASAAIYSGTLGAAEEGALAGITSIGVSLDDMRVQADFTTVEQLFPRILEWILANRSTRYGVYYNVNFPRLAASEIKGVRLAKQGIAHWVKEFRPYDYDIFDKIGITPADMGIAGFPKVESGETVYVMMGDYKEDPRNDAESDCVLLSQGYITISVHNIDSTDYTELERLRKCDITL